MTNTTTTPRADLEYVLRREADDAKKKLERALAETASNIAHAQQLMKDGMAVPTTVSGDGMIVGQYDINQLAREWMKAEQRIPHLLSIYDNGR